MRSFFPNIFCCSYFGGSGKPQGFVYLFCNWPLNWVFFSVGRAFSPCGFLWMFRSSPLWSSSPAAGRFCGWGRAGVGGGREGRCLALSSGLGKRHFSLRNIQGSISKQNIFSMKELLLRQLVFWSGITECTSQQIQNTLLFKTRPFPTRSATNVLLFSHLGHVGKCVLRELAGRRPGEGARLDECSRVGAWLVLVCWAPNSC